MQRTYCCVTASKTLSVTDRSEQFSVSPTPNDATSSNSVLNTPCKERCICDRIQVIVGIIRSIINARRCGSVEKTISPPRGLSLSFKREERLTAGLRLPQHLGNFPHNASPLPCKFPPKVQTSDKDQNVH